LWGTALERNRCEKDLLPDPMLARIDLLINGKSIILNWQHVKKLFVRPIRTMSIESSIEARIKQAIERGEFDDLPGKGKPLDLDAYFAVPEDLRMAYAMLKSSNFVPEEVEVLREIAELKEKIGTCSDEAERPGLVKSLNEKTLALTLLLENRKRKR
jgi:Domain of unknown function (DUF1992)